MDKTDGKPSLIRSCGTDLENAEKLIWIYDFFVFDLAAGVECRLQSLKLAIRWRWMVVRIILHLNP